MKTIIFRVGAILLFVLLATIPISSQERLESNLEKLKTDYRRSSMIEFPDNAPYSPQIAALGKMLFFDPRLSKSQNMSCSTCHNPSFGWETPVDKAIGALNVPLNRHAPTLLNLADAPHLMWDGRANSLEEQAMGPLTNPFEMNIKVDELISRVVSIKSYKKWFDQLFPAKGVRKETILRAIATYERTIQSGQAPFDRWLDGQEDAISETAKQGFLLFNGKFGCANCHSGWNFTNHSVHDIGLDTQDIGRGELEPGNPYMQHAFKTAGLRNISTRAPYMHNGEVETLEDVIRHYVSGGITRPSKSTLVKTINIEAGEIQALISFLDTLTEDRQDVQTPTLPSK